MWNRPFIIMPLASMPFKIAISFDDDIAINEPKKSQPQHFL